MIEPQMISRRTILLGFAATAVLAGPSRAETEDMEKAIRAYANGRTLQPGKVKIDVAPLVENGNSVSIALDVDHPMTPANHVTSVALFNEKNPQPEVGVFRFSPRSGRARVETRIRLATTQHLVAIARMSDGSLWSDKVEVIVTIAACTEE